MSPILLICCALATWSSVQAVTVSVDRGDVKVLPTHSSMIANGWRPVSGYDTIGTNVSPSRELERSAVRHPVHAKLQEHLAASEKLKYYQKSKPHDYSPPAVSGSFGSFGHASTKPRGKPKDYVKQVGSETREFAFLIPPPRDVFRFDVDPHRKAILRDNDVFLRQPTFISQSHQSDIRNLPGNQPTFVTQNHPTNFFPKGPVFQQTTHVPNFSKTKPFVSGFGVQQTLQPPRHQAAQQFESQKISNAKTYQHPPGVDEAVRFTKDNNGNTFERYQSQNHAAQVPSGGSGNFFTQVDHSSPFKTSFERDPAFLVHESHEVSYVTPPSNFNYNFRPAMPYDTLIPPGVYSSTAAPKSPSNNFIPSAPNGGQRNGGFKPFVQDEKQPAGPVAQPGRFIDEIATTYYVSEHQDVTPPPSSWSIPKGKITTEINEVLPRKTSPAKFRQESLLNPNSVNHHQQQQQQQQRIPEVIFIRPEVQQPFQSPAQAPVTIRQQTSQQDYETPESISLKHFNEQQFYLQQQLIEQDRQRLRDQELQQQLEIKRQQESELKKQQVELKVLEEQLKKAEEEREQEKIQSQLEEQQKNAFNQHTTVQGLTTGTAVTQEYFTIQQQPQAEVTEPSRLVPEENFYRHQQQQQLEQQQLQTPQLIDTQTGDDLTRLQGTIPETQLGGGGDILREHVQPQEESSPESQPESRPYRPKKPLRGQTRRRRPSTTTTTTTTTTSYEVQPTEAPYHEPKTYQFVSEAMQTTAQPETVTLPVTLKPRLRRPGAPLRRRRPSTTTPETETYMSAVNEEEISEYESPVTDISKRRRVRPTQQIYEEVPNERKPTIRRRPGHRTRVNPGEPFEAEVITETIKPSTVAYEEVQTEWENYPENPGKNSAETSDDAFQQSQTLPTRGFEVDSTPTTGVEEGLTRPTAQYHYTNTEPRYKDPLDRLQNGNANIPLEDLFDKPEENHVEPIATTVSTTSTSRASTTEATTTRASHRIRPLRFGNVTRPRFSVKDYRSRLDLKNRLTQVSSTEAPQTSPQGRRKSTTLSPLETSSEASPPRETTGRYKYMSRVSYRTTSTAPSTSVEQTMDRADVTTEKTSRFVPRRKPINPHLYRSRIAATKQQNTEKRENATPVKHNTARPENIFSSSIRRRPNPKSKPAPATEETEVKSEDITEMTAEETSFYSAATTPHLVDSANEVVHKDEAALSTKLEDGERKDEAKETKRDDAKSVEETSQESSKTEENAKKEEVAEETSKTERVTTDATVKPKEDDADKAATDVQTEEELLLKASQSVADLTSAASALYDKPGMFKAVSPATESRAVNPHFKITTDDATLPIEAFFQELSKKD